MKVLHISPAVLNSVVKDKSSLFGLKYHLLFLGEFLDILAVSCDSFNEETNLQIGRHQNGKDHLRSLSNARDWCRKYRVAFKINTVVNWFNVEEDMNHKIQELAPVRWKVSRRILVEMSKLQPTGALQTSQFMISLISDQQ